MSSEDHYFWTLGPLRQRHSWEPYTEECLVYAIIWADVNFLRVGLHFKLSWPHTAKTFPSQTVYICSNQLSSFQSLKTFPWSKDRTTFSIPGCTNSSQVKEHSFPSACLVSRCREHAQGASKQGSPALLPSSLTRPPASLGSAGEHILGLGFGLPRGSLSITVADKWECGRQWLRQTGLKPRLEERRDKGSRRDQVQREWGGWTESKLWDTQEAVSQTHLFGFGGAFSDTFMCSLLLSWMRKRITKYFNAPLKDNYYNEKSFWVFFFSGYLWTTHINIFTEKKKCFFILFSPQWWISPWVSLNVKRKRHLLRNI